MTVRGLDPETGEAVEIKKLSNDEQSLAQAFVEPPGPSAVFRHFNAETAPVLIVPDMYPGRHSPGL